MDKLETIHYNLNVTLSCSSEVHQLIAKTVLRLPKEIAEKVIGQVTFTSVEDIYGRYELHKPSIFSGQNTDVHLIILKLDDIKSEDEQLYIITHEIAHFTLDHCNDVGNPNIEDEADNLCEKWGFPIPERRKDN